MHIIMILGVLYALMVIYSLAYLYAEHIGFCSKRKRAWFWLTIPFTIWFIPIVVLLIVVSGLLKDAFGSGK